VHWRLTGNCPTIGIAKAAHYYKIPVVDSLLRSLKQIGDPTRIRILLLLRHNPLSVAELQEILGMGQSRISSQLAQLKQAGLVEARRSGKHSIYALREPSPDAAANTGLLLSLAEKAGSEIEEAGRDQHALEHVLRRRKDRMRAYFDQLAGKFGRDYVPGRSWKGLCEALFHLLPPMVIADLGAGEGTLSQLLAQKAERVIAIDNSERMVEFGTRLATKNRIKNLEYRLGDIENIPLDKASVDLAVLSQALHHAADPQQAINEARRILRPNGRILILDLLEHQFEDARELYADIWLGFPQTELILMLEKAGFIHIHSSIVDREAEKPHFETLLAIAQTPA